MSATIFNWFFMARRAGAFLHYLHLDVAIAGLALAFVFSSGLFNSSEFFASMRSDQPGFAASTEAEALSQAEALPAKRLAPAMGAALDNVAQRYRVSREALLPVFETAQAAGHESRLDPLLIIAVISIESRFNPFSQSPMGAQGLMQIIPRYHQEKLPKGAGSEAFLDPVTNVKMGARILQEYIQRQGGLVEGLQYYNGASDDLEQAYATKVLAEMNRLEQVSRRKDGVTT